MDCPLTAMLLSRDAQTLSTIDKTFEQFNIEADVCLSADGVPALIEKRKFDLLILDLDVPGVTELTGRKETKTFPHAVIALTGETSVLKHALSQNVHFVVQKPFTASLMAKTVRAAHSLIVREKRAAFRHSVTIDAQASFERNNQTRDILGAMVADLSSTGLLLKSNTAVPKDSTIKVQFRLPGTSAQVRAVGTVVWTDHKGEIGVHFQSMPLPDQKELQQWLKLRCPWDIELGPKAMQAQDGVISDQRLQ